MGLRYVKGLGEADWQRIDNARRAGPFRSLADLASRTGLRQASSTALPKPER